MKVDREHKSFKTYTNESGAIFLGALIYLESLIAKKLEIPQEAPKSPSDLSS